MITPDSEKDGEGHDMPWTNWTIPLDPRCMFGTLRGGCALA